MNATTDFFVWFFVGLNGLGGWFLFFLFAVAAVVWLLYDSQKRRLSVIGWRIGIIGLACLLLPALIFRFSSPETQASLEGFTEIIFYLGLLGGLLPIVLGVGYYVTFKDLLGCQYGHEPYDVSLGECPECAAARIKPAPQAIPIQPQQPHYPEPAPVQNLPPQRPMKPKAQAWLVTTTGQNQQLCIGVTTIGRSSKNDIQITDPKVSGEHAKIVEQNGHYKLYDLGSTNGTWVNEHRVRQPVLLDADDQIRFGDNVVMRFVK